MTRFCLRLVLSLLVSFMAATLLIRLQPYDDRDLRQLLLPDGCPVPCFMGIRVGITTLDEAVKLLQASGWINTDQPELIDGGKEITMRFKWTGEQPDLINSRQELAMAYPKSGSPKITQIGLQVQLDMKLGTLHRMLGNPSGFAGSSLRGINIGIPQPASLVLEEYYEDYHINLLTFSSCPTNPDRLLNTKMIWVIYYDKLPPNTVAKLSGSNLKTVLRAPHCE
jgi:hypothetical protein